MAYRFKLDEPFAKGFRRIGLGQIECAGRELARGADRPRAIHETRKALKRVRALLRLVRPTIGEKDYRRENRRFREIAHKLAGEREFDVLIETAAKLEALARDERQQKALASLKNEAVAARSAHTGASDTSTTKEALTLLAKLRNDFPRLGFDGQGFAVVGKGLRRGYRKGRRACKAAYGEPTDEAFHEVRKAVQLHWRHMSLMARAWPELLEARVAAAKQLSQILGDDHDLAVLVGFARRLTPPRLAAEDVAAISQMARGRQGELRAAAKPLLEQLYAESSRRFVKRLARYWSSAQAASHLQKTGATHASSSRPARPSKASA